MNQLIGLSLSLCIAQIIDGKVRENDVEKIIANTKADSPEKIDELIQGYRNSYWSTNPDLGEEIARKFFEKGKIEQPRVTGEQHPGLAEDQGCWKTRRFSFHFSDGQTFYASGIDVDQAYACVEGVLDDMDETDECNDEIEIFEGTEEWNTFQESFSKEGIRVYGDV